MRALADRAEISQPRIAQYEAGETPRQDTVARIARALVPADLPSDEAGAAYDRLLRAGLRAAFMPDEPAFTDEAHEIAARFDRMEGDDQRLFLELARAKTANRELGIREPREPIGPDYNEEDDN